MGLPNHIATILKMEDSDFCKVITGSKQTEQRAVKQGANVNFRSAPFSDQLTWKSKQHSGESNSATNKQSERSTNQNQASTSGGNQNQMKLSEAEYAYKKRNGLCYKCPEKWSKTHICRNKELQLLLVLEERIEDKQEEVFHDSHEDINEVVAEIMELSLYSFLGWS